MPQFCRHNRLIQNCPICTQEQDVELRPLVSSSAPRSLEPRRRPAGEGGRGGPRSASRGPRRPPGVTVSRLRNASDDGYRSGLVPGLKSSDEARRLAEELAFGQTRLDILAANPPGLYREVADSGGDLEERTWLAFLIAYLGPEEGAEEPFGAISAARTSWASGLLPELAGVATGPRTAYDPARGLSTLEGYRGWATRAGSQAEAIVGEHGWSPERRFARTFERLALPGLHRDARFEFLLSLARTGVYELQPASLALGGGEAVTVAAKRALGIGDPALLERRSAQLVEACDVSLAALDLAYFNWETGERAAVGVWPGVEPDPEIAARTARALGV